MKPFIQNISKAAYAAGDHFDCGPRAVAIEILDPCGTPVVPKHKFAKTHTLHFLDVEAEDKWGEEFAVTDGQAAELVDILQDALQERRNVIVHCTVGMCRSGAVAEVGVMMGFTDTGAYRQPNVLVKDKMLSALCWGYSK